MSRRTRRAAALKGWVFCLAGVILVEAGVCALLFIPQSRALAKARRDAETVEEQMSALGLTTFKATFTELSGKVARAEENLERVSLFRDEPAQERIINAIAEANAAGRVLLTDLKPVVEKARPAAEGSGASRSRRRRMKNGQKAEPPIGQTWRLRCRGAFPDVLAFLRGIEQRGVLLGASGFTAGVSQDAAAVDVEVLLRVFSQESLDALTARIAAERKTAAVKARARAGTGRTSSSEKSAP